MLTPTAATLLTALLETKGNRQNLLTHKPFPPLNQWNCQHLMTHQEQTSINFTFIIHKSNFPNLPSTRQTRCPSFATFDHDDHYHFIYEPSHINNNARHLNSILTFLGARYPAVAEAHTTNQI
jgi:hypothetical protein